MPQSAFSSTLEPNVTLNFDLLNPKLVEAFVLVPKCTKAENFVKIYPIIVLITFGTHEQTDSADAQAHEQQENTMPLTTLHLVEA